MMPRFSAIATARVLSLVSSSKDALDVVLDRVFARRNVRRNLSI
jgi:hypothetical protein